MAQQTQPNPFSINGLAGMDMNGQHGQQRGMRHGVNVQDAQQQSGPPTSTPMDMGVNRYGSAELHSRGCGGAMAMRLP